jgi:hypothetical protein
MPCSISPPQPLLSMLDYWKLESQVEADKAQLVEAKSKNRDFTDQAIFFAALSTTEDLATRTRLHQEIRRKVARIDFWFHRDKNTPHLVPDSKNDLFPFARVTFTNGQERFIVLVENGFVTLIRQKRALEDTF